MPAVGICINVDVPLTTNCLSTLQIQLLSCLSSANRSSLTCGTITLWWRYGKRSLSHLKDLALDRKAWNQESRESLSWTFWNLSWKLALLGTEWYWSHCLTTHVVKWCYASLEVKERSEVSSFLYQSRCWGRVCRWKFWLLVKCYW